jgi:glycosyltransferase involved in cell wall biosynthesis
MRIAIVTDAWSPQTNGVVSTLRQTTASLEKFGHEILHVTPNLFRSVPCPTYPEIRLALFPYRKLSKLIGGFRPDAIHIATEGSLGFAARRYCMRNRLQFTTSYHTQFPQYLRSRFPIPTAFSYRALLWFHGAATHCMVSTQTVRNQLAERGFRNLVRWQRGVDTELFKPGAKDFLQLPRPIAAYVGRVAIEKNIDAFLRMPWKGTRLVIGDGPELPRLKVQFPDVVYAGFRFGEDLARHLAASDVFVFPSLTDTFGLVNLEAMACGVPVAAYPVAGPIDVVEDGVTGALHEDLAHAALRALAIDPQKCRDRALRSGWEMCSREFESNLVPCHGQRMPHAMPTAARAPALRQPV